MLHSLRDMQSEGIDMRASVTKQSQLLEALMRKMRNLTGSPASPGEGTTSISTGGVTSTTSSQSTNELVTKEGFFSTEVNTASKEVACVKREEGQIRKRKKKAPIQTNSPGETSFQTTPTLGKRKSTNQNHDVPLFTTTTTSAAAQHEFYVATSSSPPLVQDNFPRNTPHFTHSPSPTNSFPQTKYRKYSTRPVEEEPPASYHQNYTVSFNQSPTPATMPQPSSIPQSNYGVPGPMRLAGVNELLALDTTGVHLPPLNLPPLHQPVSSNYQLPPPPPYAQPQQYYQPPPPQPQPIYNYYGTPQPYYHGPHYSYNNYYYK